MIKPRKSKGKAADWLTEKDLRDAKPGEKVYRIADAATPEMKIRVQPTGRKLFEIRYGPNQSKSYVLGRWPGMTLETARAECQRILVEIRDHGAPLSVVEERKALEEVAAEQDAAQAAEAAAAKETADRKAGRLIVTLGDLITHKLEDHLTINQKAGKGNVGRLRAKWAELLDRPLTSITAAEVEDEATKRLKAGIKNGTVNRDVGVLKSAMARAVKLDIIPSHPLGKIKPKSERLTGVVRYLGSDEADPDEEKRLRAALAARDQAAIEARRRTVVANRDQHAGLELIPDDGFADHLTPMTLLALNTGCRRGELTSLVWADISFARKVLTVRAGYAKSDKARHIDLNSEAIDVLTRWKKQKPAGKLFEVHSIKKAWAALLADAKITDFRFHDCRHDFASRLVQAGVDLNMVRELLGHSDMKMTLRYAHLAPRNTAAAVAKLVRTAAV